MLVVAGTRPEAIKLSPLVLRLREDPDLDVRLVSTGQHREILHEVFVAFGLEPDLDLKLLRPRQSLEALTARAITHLKPLLRAAAPDLLLVQGDTTTAFVAALAAFYARVPVVHLEAGLRTGDPSSPFPEEINRKLVGVLTSLHLAPTPWAKANLLLEGVSEEKIVVTGNTIVDAVETFLKHPLRSTTPNFTKAMAKAEVGPLVLITSHRRENWGRPQRLVARAVARAARCFPDAMFVVPLHPNPAVREVLVPALQGISNVELLEPLSYGEMLHALNRSSLAVTDSGGVQEEACALGVPTLVLRETTERPEAIAVGVARLVGTGEERVFEEMAHLLSQPAERERATRGAAVFGDGRASDRAHAAIRAHLGLPAPFFAEFAPEALGEPPARLLTAGMAG